MESQSFEGHMIRVEKAACLMLSKLIALVSPKFKNIVNSACTNGQTEAQSTWCGDCQLRCSRLAGNICSDVSERFVGTVYDRTNKNEQP